MSQDSIASDAERRAFFLTLSATALAAGGCAGSGVASAEAPKGEDHEEGEGTGAEVTPGEDLMQEHGVLERVLLIYDEGVARLDAGEPFDPALVASSAAVVRRFVEDYHEKLEETFVFPRLEKIGSEVALVGILKEQHLKGRELTDRITEAAHAGAPDTARLAGLLRAFVRMYRPHASREETILFPAFRKTLDKDGYRELGEKFEEREHQLFGEGGFEDVVGEVSKIEVALEIHDLARFTPQ